MKEHATTKLKIAERLVLSDTLRQNTLSRTEAQLIVRRYPEEDAQPLAAPVASSRHRSQF